MSQFEEVVVEGGGSSAPTRSGNGSAVVETVKADGTIAKPRGGSRTSDSTPGGQFANVADNMPPDVRSGRQLPDSVREKIAAIAAAHKAEQRSEDADDPDEPPGVTPGTLEAGQEASDAANPDDEAEAPAKPATKAAAQAAKDERDEIIARQKEANVRLLAELEAARKGGADDTDAARAMRIEEAEETYLRDPVASIRAHIAASMGVEPDSPDVERELRDFYVDLTSTIAGVTVDPVHQATRESARTRKEWDRDKKRRAAGEKKQADEAERAKRDDQIQFATSLIREGLKPLAGEFPSLALAPLLGQEPERLVYDLLEKGLKAGDFDPSWSDEKLLKAAATLAENHFRPTADRIRAALNTSSATADAGKAPAVAASDKSSTRQSQGARVTNADASVAPATPPAPKPTTQRKPPPLSDDEARRKYALRHLKGK